MGESIGKQPDSLSALIAHAEVLKNKKEYDKAAKVYTKALEHSPGDPFLIQRLALVTYKTRQPDAITALHNAHEIISVLKPQDSVDPETLGLSGSINKKLFEESGEDFFLEKALQFYERGFSKAKNYYNGINAAYLYLVKAANADNKSAAYVLFEKFVFANENVISICIRLIISPEFEDRNDKEYIYQTLAQAYLGLDQTHEVIKLIPTINEVSKGHFDLDIFHEQNSKLIDHLVKFKKKYPEYK
ncbi:MAG: TRAFs-binding domain-containing protein [Bacteroidota bacterium]|nr:TRAFs-binding domain-containing protein [Bacteroidota bacterium]